MIKNTRKVTLCKNIYFIMFSIFYSIVHFVTLSLPTVVLFFSKVGSAASFQCC